MGNRQFFHWDGLIPTKITTLPGQSPKRVEHLIVDRPQDVRESIIGCHALGVETPSHLRHDVVTDIHRFSLTG
jgi:hypothetical protein